MFAELHVTADSGSADTNLCIVAKPLELIWFELQVVSLEARQVGSQTVLAAAWCHSAT